MVRVSMFLLRFLVLCIIVTSNIACDEDETAEVGQFAQVFPAAKANQISTLPAFRWDQAVGATSYSLTLALDAAFTRSVITIDGLTATEFTLTEPLAAGYLYYWKVTAKNSAGERLADNAGLTFRTFIEPVTASPMATTYFVDPTGEDNPDCGTQVKPFKTLAYAASRVPANEGDVISLAPGTYNETEPAIIPTGVHVQGAGQDKTFLSSSGVTIPNDVNQAASDFHLWYDGSLIQLVSPHKLIPRNPASAAYAPANGNQTLSGFTIDGNAKTLKAGVWVENRDNVTMHHVTIKNCLQRGAVFAPGNKKWFVYPEFYMKGIKIHDCTFINSGKDLTDQSIGNLNIAQLEGAEIYNITIEDNEGYGIKFIYDGYFKDLYIHDCVITVNETDARWGEDIAIELWNLSTGNRIENIQCNTWLSIVNHPEIFGNLDGASQMKIKNVVMKDKNGQSNKEAIEIGTPGVDISNCYFENKGFGIAIWDMGRSDITVRNNIFYNTSLKNNWASGAAVYIDNSHDWPFKNIHIYNNIFDTHPVAVRIKGQKIQDIDIRNNAFFNTNEADVNADGTNIIATNNLKFTAANTPWILNGVTTNENNIIGNPGYLFSGTPDGTYYKPASASSFAVDKGIDVGILFSGSAPDIGFAEFEQ